MDVLSIPFNKFVGLELSSDPAYLLVLPAKTESCKRPLNGSSSSMPSNFMRFLELKIPPPFLALLTVAIMLGLWSLHVCPLSNPWTVWTAIPLAVLGIIFGLPSMIRFRKVGTTIKPTHPEKATRLVVSGMYRFSRNPMYLGATLILLAIGVFLDDGLALLPVPLFVVYLNYFQIVPEERALEELFGDEYRDYKKRVRRWI